MPELPEVETIARGLHALVRGAASDDARLLTPGVLRAGNPESLPGRNHHPCLAPANCSWSIWTMATV
jgi:formamidopyrimidine-DNA glycosylase